MSEVENVKLEWQIGQHRACELMLRNGEELDDEQLAAYAPQS